MARGSRAINYSVEELAWIKAHCTWPRAKAHAAFVDKFGRHDVRYENYHALCKRNKWFTGRTGHFDKGIIPANKGKKMVYTSPQKKANAHRHLFKDGHTPHNQKTIGHEWLHPQGYLYIIIDEVNPHTGFRHRSVLKHVYLWEKKNGKIPDGMCLKCIDGNRANAEPDNWKLVSKGVVPLLTGRWDGYNYEDMPAELKESVLLRAQLRHQLKERKKNG